MNISHSIATIIFNLPGIVLKGNRYMLNDDKKINISQLAETINLAQYNAKLPSNQRIREKLRENSVVDISLNLLVADSIEEKHSSHESPK